MWFEQTVRQRFDHVLNILEDSGADFICLQEVTDTTRKMILENEHIRTNYFVSGNDIGGHGYGVLILARQECHFY